MGIIRIFIVCIFFLPTSLFAKSLDLNIYEVRNFFNVGKSKFIGIVRVRMEPSAQVTDGNSKYLELLRADIDQSEDGNLKYMELLRADIDQSEDSDSKYMELFRAYMAEATATAEAEAEAENRKNLRLDIENYLREKSLIERSEYIKFFKLEIRWGTQLMREQLSKALLDKILDDADLKENEQYIFLEYGKEKFEFNKSSSIYIKDVGAAFFVVYLVIKDLYYGFKTVLSLNAEW